MSFTMVQEETITLVVALSYFPLKFCLLQYRFSPCTGVSRNGAKAQRLIQTNSKHGAVVSSKDEKALRV